jgi:transglutaminase-like putative cysteine protease
MKIRLGYELIYDCPQPVPMILMLNIHYSRAADIISGDKLTTDPVLPVSTYRDGFGNWCSRLVAPAGRTTITSTAIIRDAGGSA